MRVTSPLKQNPIMVLKRKTLQQECENLNKEHEKKFGISCDFQLERHINNKLRKMTCPYCDLELKFTKLWEVKIRQVTNVLMNSYATNLYNLTENKSLNIKEFAEAKLAEAKTLRLLKSMSSNRQFKSVKKSGKSLARCLTYNPLRGDFHYFGKEIIWNIYQQLFKEQNPLTGKEPGQNIRFFALKNSVHTSVKDKTCKNWPNKTTELPPLDICSGFHKKQNVVKKGTNNSKIIDTPFLLKQDYVPKWDGEVFWYQEPLSEERDI